MQYRTYNIYICMINHLPEEPAMTRIYVATRHTHPNPQRPYSKVGARWQHLVWDM